MATVDSLTIGKLAIAKQLLSRAGQAAAEPGPIAPGLGVSLSQDALELILRAAADHHRVTLPGRSEFEELIKILVKAGIQIPHQPRLLQINRARVSFKHLGNLPDEAQAKTMVEFARLVAEEMCQACLGVSLWEVTSIHLIPRTRIRNHLNRAGFLKTQGDFEGCCTSSAVAFALAFGDIEGRRREHSRGVPGEQIRNLQVRWHGDAQRDALRGLGRDIQEAVVRDFQTVTRDLDYLFDQVALLKQGINLDALSQFERLIPSVRIGHRIKTISLTQVHQRQFLEEDASFALEFATDAILRIRLALQPSPGTSSNKVRVQTETPLQVGHNSSGEVIVIAEVGDTFDRPDHPHDSHGYFQVLFEGEPGYLISSAVEQLPSP